METVVFRDMNVTWIDFHKHMIVRDSVGTLLFSTLGYRHPRLSPKDIGELNDFYNAHKKSYDFREV